MIAGARARTNGPQAVPVQRAPEDANTAHATHRVRRFASQQASPAATLLALAIALIAAIVTASGTARWATSVLTVPSTDGITAALGAQQPERPLVGARPVEAPANDCASFSNLFSV